MIVSEELNDDGISSEDIDGDEVDVPLQNKLVIRSSLHKSRNFYSADEIYLTFFISSEEDVVVDMESTPSTIS